MENLTIVTPRYPPYVGGVENHVQQLAKRAVRFFKNVSVISTDPIQRFPSEERSNGVNIFRIRAFAPRENYHFPSLTGLFKLMRESQPQVLHLHCIHDVTGPVAGLMRGKSTLLFTPHFVGRMNSGLGKVLYGAYRPFVRELVARTPRIICISRFESRVVTDNFPEATGKVEVIPNGVDSDLSERNPWRAPEVPSVLYAGRLENYKNVDLLMKAVASLRGKYANLRVRIVGKGPYKANLVSLSRSLGLDDSIDWYDRLPQKDLFPLYASSTAVVLASEFENWGNVVAEAIAVGAPTIVANASSLAEFVDDGLAQPVEPHVNPEKLAAKISEVLEDPSGHSPRGIKSPLIRSWDEIAEATFHQYSSAAMS